MNIENKDTLQILKKHKKEVEIQIQEIDAVLNKIDLQNTGNASNILQNIHHTLHKASVFTASCVLMKQLNEQISFKDTDVFIDMLEKAFKLQRKNIVKKEDVFTLREIRDNFKFWSSVDKSMLCDILVKEHYLFAVMKKILLLGRQWSDVIVKFQCDVAFSVQYFIDVNTVLEGDKTQNDFLIAKKTLDTAVHLCEDTGQACITMYSHNKVNFDWLAKALYFFKVTKRISKLQKNEIFIASINRRIQRVVKQFNTNVVLYNKKITFDEFVKKAEI